MSSMASIKPLRSVHVGLLAGAGTLSALGPVARHLVVGLLDEPMAVTWICPAATDVSGLPAPPMEIIHYGLTRWPFVRERMIELLARQISHAGITLMHALDVDLLPLARDLSDILGLDYVLSAFAPAPQLKIEDVSCRAVLAASEPVYQSLLADPGVATDLISLVRPGVLAARTPTCFAHPEHDVAIVAAGDLRQAAPYAVVLEAFAHLRRAEWKCILFLAGNGRAEPALRRAAEKMGLMADLNFIDHQGPEQLADILRSADIVIAPDAHARVDVDLLSAMASGTPVVTCASDVNDFVIPELTALTFEPGNAAALAMRLTKLMQDHDAARRLADGAIEYLRKSHSPAAMVQSIAKLYQRIAR